MMSIINWFKELSQNDSSTVGSKAASIGELVNARFPVPEGFVVTTEAYQQFIDLAGIRQKISAALSEIDYDNQEQLNSASEEITSLILLSQMPSEISREIKNAYEELCHKKDIIISGKTDIPVRMVTSNFESPPIDGVHGAAAVIQTVQKLWASIYIPENLKKFSEGGRQPSAAVLIQKLVMSEKAGIMRGEGDGVTIEAGWGLAEAIKTHGVMFDRYLVSGSEIIDKEINDQDWMYRIIPDGAKKKTDVLGSQRNIQKLTDQEIINLAELYRSYTNYTGSPTEVEWSIVGRDLFLVDAEPIPEKQAEPEPELGPPEPEPAPGYQPQEPEPASGAESDDPLEGLPAQSQETGPALQPISEYEQKDHSQQISEYEGESSQQAEDTHVDGLLIREPAAALTLEGRLDGITFVLVDADSLAAKIVPENPDVTNEAVLELMRQVVGKCRDRGIKVGVTGGFAEGALQQVSSIGFDQIFSDSA